MTSADHRPAHGGYPGHPRGGGMDRLMGYDIAASLVVHGRYPFEPCACRSTCGDDGDIDGPGTCKGLPRAPKPPLVEIVMVPRRER